MNNQTPEQRSSGNFVFTFPTLFAPEIKVGEKSFDTVVSEASWCFIFIGDFFDQTEMYDTNKTFTSSQWKLETALFELIKKRPHGFKFYIKRSNSFTQLRDPQLSSTHETVDALQENTRAKFSSSWEHSISKQRFSGSLAFAFSTLFEYDNQVLRNSLQNCCDKSKLLFF